jgi:hypothetical protein
LKKSAAASADAVRALTADMVATIAIATVRDSMDITGLPIGFRMFIDWVRILKPALRKFAR